ncbi:MAG: hypothetical protein WBC63_09665 [Candidatus Bipolaricaulia bacterium]
MISDLLERVMVLADGIMDALVARPFVFGVGEQRLKGRSSSCPFSAEDVRIKWRFGESGPHSLSELLAAE